MERGRQESGVGDDYVRFPYPDDGDANDSLLSLGVGGRMKWRDFWDSPEELFVWGFLQMPLYFIVGWKILLIMPITALLGRWGGVTGGVKMARWLGVPLVVCLSAILCGASWWVLLAAPFMEKLSPFGYGKESWLFQLLKKDLPVRLINFGWYWTFFAIAYLLSQP